MTQIQEQMLSAFPKESALFDGAVDAALRQIHNEAALERQTVSRRQIKRVLAWGLIGALLLAGAFGVAEGIRRGVFDFLIHREDALPQATELVQTDLAEMRVGHTDLCVTEAVYDGATVRFVMSVRNDTIQRPLTGNEVYGEDEMGEALAKDGVTAMGSFDWFTIDGVKYGMTGGSGGANDAGENDGEALMYFELLLSSEGEEIAAPTGDFTLGVPVRHADTQEERQMFIPVKYIAAKLLRDITPSAPATLVQDGVAYTVTVMEAKLSPVRNVVELRVDVPDAASEDEAWACVQPWYDFALVDEHGAELGNGSTSYYGLPSGETDDIRHFVIRMEFSPLESYPDRLFVAPVGFYGADGGWGAEMGLAVELNGEGTK